MFVVYEKDGVTCTHYCEKGETNPQNFVTKIWRLNGMNHRVGDPAIIHADGQEEWYEYNQKHRIGGPSSNDGIGNYEYHYRGLFHRVGGPASVSTIRELGTIVFKCEAYYHYGMSHRDDGPAFEWSDRAADWFLYGNIYSFKEWLQIAPCSAERKTKLKLKYS